MVRSHLFLFSSFSLGLALALPACSERHGFHSRRGGSVSSASACTEATTCQACTPLLGCGWCALPDGTGRCTDGPDECEAPQFSWTWEPNGCRTPVEAGTIVISGPDGDADVTNETPDAGPDASADVDAAP